jgi:hypothetical protein
VSRQALRASRVEFVVSLARALAPLS